MYGSVESSLLTGTYYLCGCWRGGPPKDHPYHCRTHEQPWKIKYVEDVSRSNPKLS